MKGKRSVILRTPAEVIDALGGPLAVAKQNGWGRSRVGNWSRLKAFPGRSSIRMMVSAMAAGLRFDPLIFNTTAADMKALKTLLTAA